MEHKLIDQRITFTLDLEDHRPVREGAERYPAITRTVLEFLAERSVRGTFFVTGEIAENSPDLVRDVAEHGHELAFHGFHHVPFTQLEPDQLREEAKRAKALLEDLGGHEVLGFRAPTFSLVPESRWAVDVLAELGFTYSSSVLPARSPLFGDPTAPAGAVPLAERPDRAAVPGRARRGRRAAVPRRRLPARAAHRRTARRPPHLRQGPAPLDLLPPVRLRHRPSRSGWCPRSGRLGSRLLWYNRRRTFAKVDTLLRRRPARRSVSGILALETVRPPGEHR